MTNYEPERIRKRAVVAGRGLAAMPCRLKICIQKPFKESLTTKFLLVLASTVNLGSESHRSHDNILISDGPETL
jgi:hypothetical protein